MPDSVELQRYAASWPEDDVNANFKAEVALYSIQDPLPTLVEMSRLTGIPVGALARYVLVRWASACGDALLAIGPVVLQQLREQIERAETVNTDEARLSAYRALRDIIAWLAAGSE